MRRWVDHRGYSKTTCTVSGQTQTARQHALPSLTPNRQVSELHLDERFNTGKDVLGKHLAEGQKKVSSAFNNLWADIEVMREAQRRRYEERQAAAAASAGSGRSSASAPASPVDKPSKCEFPNNPP